MSISSLKKEQKRNDILDAADGVFFKDGYIGASMDTIAKQAGVTKQTVYRYFESKEFLFQAALERKRESKDISIYEELNREDPYEALKAFAIVFLQLHMSESHLAAIRLLVSEGPKAPEITRAFYTGGPRKTQSSLLHLFETKSDVDDPEYAVKMLISTLLSMRMNVLVGLSPLPSQEELITHAERTVAIFKKHFKSSAE